MTNSRQFKSRNLFLTYIRNLSKFIRRISRAKGQKFQEDEDEAEVVSINQRHSAHGHQKKKKKDKYLNKTPNM